MNQKSVKSHYAFGGINIPQDIWPATEEKIALPIGVRLMEISLFAPPVAIKVRLHIHIVDPLSTQVVVYVEDYLRYQIVQPLDEVIHLSPKVTSQIYQVIISDGIVTGRPVIEGAVVTIFGVVIEESHVAWHVEMEILTEDDKKALMYFPRQE